MTEPHLVFLVEEPSMEAFLRAFMPRVLPDHCTFEAHSFQGKTDLLHKLESRLRAYAKWLPETWRIVVIVDRDDDNCKDLKKRLETIAVSAGLQSKSKATKWQIVSRIAIEELEAWYFGDWQAVRNVFPKAPPTIPSQANFRNPDAIPGGTWESLERILQRAGYFSGGLRKVELGRLIGASIEANRNVSSSFREFHQAIMEAIS